MKYTDRYRYIRDIREEGAEFDSMLRRAAHFYIDVMKCRIRRDGPDTLIKYSRDREYPWAIIKSEINPGQKALDCGSGYSPLPFIWSQLGAEAHAIDRDIVVSSKPLYALYCFLMVIVDIVKIPIGVLSKAASKKAVSENKNAEPSGNKKNIIHSLKYRLIDKNVSRFSRILKPDFWGPVSPGLLRKYRVNYKKGDIAKLPYKNDYFDVISCISVLEHMPLRDQIEGIREMSRALKKRGRLIITYDKYKEDLTDRFIEESGMIPEEIVYFLKPDNLYERETMPDIIGILLVK